MHKKRVGTRTMMTPADRVKCAMSVFRLSPVEVRELTGASDSSLDGGDLPEEAIARFAEHLELPQEWFRGADPTICLLYTSPSPRDRQKSRMPSSA